MKNPVVNGWYADPESRVYGDTVYFLGDIKTHPNADAIIDFINANKKRAISLSSEPLRDLGGIIFIERN